MTTLLMISIGPVQDFIAEARRSRDLWFGSHLLSELSREVAKAVAEAGGLLIFPAIKAGDLELQFCDRPLRFQTKKPPQNIANKILAELPVGVDAKAVAEGARKALQGRWKSIAEEVWTDNRELLCGKPGVRQTWDEQVGTILEFAAAWVAEGEGGYKEAREALDGQMAARKNLRDFVPWEAQLGERKKSSLDGQRESVIEAGQGKSRRRRLKIGEKEELDAIGLIKRTGGDPEQFLPLANIAYAEWLSQIWDKHPEAKEEIEGVCQEAKIKRVYRDRQGGELPRILRVFRYDAHIFSPQRWGQIFEEGREDATEAEKKEIQKEAEAWGQAKIRPFLRKARREPMEYLACLVADGDRMGKMLDQIRDPQGHRIVSLGLAGFAEQARKILEQTFRGSLIYAGGDDVLGFVCLADAADCAKALSDAFGRAMQKAVNEVKKQTGEDVQAYLPTLSVGLGIGHVLESMGYLLELGRKAEKLAKGGSLPAGEQRNALAIVLDKRSGGQTSWRCRWGDDPTGELRGALGILKGEFSSKKIYEVQAILRRMPKIHEVEKKPTAEAKKQGASGAKTPPSADSKAWAFVLQEDIKRTLGRTKIDWKLEKGDEKRDAKTVDLNFPEAEEGYEKSYRAVERWVSRMLIARLLVRESEETSGEAEGSGWTEGDPR